MIKVCVDKNVYGLDMQWVMNETERDTFDLKRQK